MQYHKNKICEVQMSPVHAKPENKAWIQAQPLPLPVGTASHVGQSLFDSFQFCCFGFTI